MTMMKSNRSLSIYYLEDERLLQKLFLKYFSELKEFESKIFPTCGEALIAIKDHPPDILILDYQLPDKNSVQFLKEIQENVKTLIPIKIFLSGTKEKEVLRKVKDLDIDLILNKPIKFKDLQEKINLLIEKKKLL